MNSFNCYSALSLLHLKCLEWSEIKRSKWSLSIWWNRNCVLILSFISPILHKTSSKLYWHYLHLSILNQKIFELLKVSGFRALLAKRKWLTYGEAENFYSLHKGIYLQIGFCNPCSLKMLSSTVSLHDFVHACMYMPVGRSNSYISNFLFGWLARKLFCLFFLVFFPLYFSQLSCHLDMHLITLLLLSLLPRPFPFNSFWIW